MMGLNTAPVKMVLREGKEKRWLAERKGSAEAP